MNLRLLLALLIPATAAFAQTPIPSSEVSRLDPAMGTNDAAADNLEWHDVTTWGMEGREWADRERLRWFDRFPAAAEKTVTKNVWALSRHTAGLMTRFKTDAASISVHYVLYKNSPQPHMPATGVSGVDLYARDPSGKWRWVQATKPVTQEIRAELIKDLPPGAREYALYLPLYNGVNSLEIGVPKGSKFEPLAPRPKPIVFYGTSTTQGGCASRPGMAYPAILGRRLDVPVVNLGFSGNGKMDAAVGDLLTKIDAAMYVIDCLGNMQPAEVAAKCAPLVRQLRAAKPDTPIVILEEHRVTNAWVARKRVKLQEDKFVQARLAFATLKNEGMKNIHYIADDDLYGADSEGAVDGSHGTDLGFMRQAGIMEPPLRAILRL